MMLSDGPHGIRKQEGAGDQLGLDEISESEGLARAHMRLPQSQMDLIEAAAVK